MVGRFAGEMINVFLHRRVMSGEDARLAVVFVEIAGDEQQRAIPRGAEAVAPSAGRNDRGQITVVALRVLDVVDPSRVNARAIEGEEALLGGEMGIARPAILLA